MGEVVVEVVEGVVVISCFLDGGYRWCEVVGVGIFG